MTILKRPANPEPETIPSQFTPQPNDSLSQSAKLLEILKAPSSHSIGAGSASKIQSMEPAIQPKPATNEKRVSLTSNTFQPPQAEPLLHQLKQATNGFDRVPQRDDLTARTLPSSSSEHRLHKFPQANSIQTPEMNRASHQQAPVHLLPKENTMPAVPPKEKQEHLASLLETFKSTKAMVPNPTSLSLSPDSLVAQYQIKSPESEQDILFGTGPTKMSVPSNLGVEKPSSIIVPPPKILTPSLSPTFDRRQVVKNEDAQQLLGLFRQVKALKDTSPAPSTSIIPPVPRIIPAQNTTTTQLVSPQAMLPSPIVQGPSARKRSLLSPDKNELLLGYLDEIAKQYGH